MAVSENDLIVGPLTPAAGVTTISLDFYFEQASWLEVYKSGSETPLVFNTDYTVTGAGTGSGVVTLAVAANGTDAYSVYLIVPLQRSSDMQLRGEFKSDPFNIEMDRIWQAIQGINTRVAQSLRISRTSLVVGPLATGSAAARAGRALVFGASGSDLGIGPTTAEIASAQSFAASAGTSATEAADSAASAGTSATEAADSAASAAAYAKGDVEGPASATNNHVALFNGATGKLIKSGGFAFTAAGQAIAAATDAAAQRTTLGAAEDSSDPDFTNNPNAAARRGLVDAKLSTLLFSKEYQSTGQTMINGGLLTLAHGLPADPKLIRLYAIATVAEDGFSVGDKLDLTATVNAFPSGNYSMGLTVTFDSTNIYIRNGTHPRLWIIPNNSTGTLDIPQRADFDLYVEAYA